MALETKDLLKNYMGSIKTAVAKASADPLNKMLEKASGDSETKKMWLDHAFREYLTFEVMKGNEVDLDKCDKYIEVAIKAAKDDYCSKTLPIQLLSDMFDIITLDQCESLFSSIERNIILWKSEEFFTPVRNNLLRICNDLLRRLSRSQNTVFCGRILLFLAKFFPISERSGLNVVSEFNLENATVLRKADDENGAAKEEGMDVDSDEIKIEPDQRSLAVDYALYSKFWLLQDFFRNPVQLYENVKWRTFSSYASDVLNTFKSFKVDAISGKTQRKAEDDECGGSGKDQFFAKYLTNQNLLQLQLSDSNFRRYILLQFLILFQYLQSTVKFKSDSDVLTNDQIKWIAANEEKIYDLIRETPPFGDKFAESVTHILKREEQWNIWKNQGCPSLAPKVDPKKEAISSSNGRVGTTRKRKRKLGDHIQEAMKQGKYLMGNVALTKLWNQYPDNMEACSAPERDFLPSVEEYFGEAFEQLDPRNQIEEEYKKVNDGQWGWRALRLLAKKSPYFFTYGNNPIAKLPEYLDSMLKKMSNFVPPPSIPAATNGTKEAAAEVKASESPIPPAPATLTDSQINAIADKLGEKWTKLIPKLGLSPEDKEKIEKEGKDHKGKALLMLKKWIEVEGEGATVDEITYVLEGLKMKEVLEGVFS